MKWVLKSIGNYRLVEDDDPNPEVKLPSKKGAPYVQSPPSWKKYEEKMHYPNAKVQHDAADKFFAERAHAMKVDKSARRREESRKKAVAKDKPSWRKGKTIVT